MKTGTNIRELTSVLVLDWPNVLECYNKKTMKMPGNKQHPEEFQFRLFHRIVFTKKGLNRYKLDDECLYCGEKDSIDHIFLNCRFVKIFVNN